MKPPFESRLNFADIWRRRLAPSPRRWWKLYFILISLWFLLLTSGSSSAETLNIGSQRELFVDNFLIASKTNVQFTLHEPRDEGSVLQFNAPWEGPFCAYVTVIHDGDQFKAYYRGKSASARDGIGEVT